MRIAWHAIAGFDNINLDLMYGLPEQDIGGGTGRSGRSDRRWGRSISPGTS